MVRWTLLFLVTTFAFGQTVSPRLVIGVPLTRGSEDGFLPFRLGGELFRGRRSQYIIGGGFDTQLPLLLRLDVNVLYRRISYDSSVNARSTGVPTITIAESSVAADRWEFPVAVCYRVPARAVRPFLLTGVNLSLVSRLRGRTEGVLIPPITIGPPSPFLRGPRDALPKRVAAGWFSGGGLELVTGPLRLAPELRYTLWGRRHTDGFSGLQFSRHQLDLLLGFRF